MLQIVEAKQWTARKSPESMVGVVVLYFAVLVLLQFTSSALIEQCPKANAVQEGGIG